MPSTFFIGAQDSNADDVPFKDRAKFHFLLHFWPYIAQVYVPRFVDNEGEVKTNGFVLAIPDVANLGWFCEELPILLKNRNPEVFGYRPKSCFVDISIEGALDTLKRLQERIAVLGASLDTLVLGIDVFHAYKPPDNPQASVETKGVARVTPEVAMIDEYSRLQHALWNPLIKRQILLNLVSNRPWYDGFDKVLSNLPYKELFSEQCEGFKYFRHDLRWLLSPGERREQAMPDEILADVESEGNINQIGMSYELLVYRVINVYIRRKLKSKYELEWSAVKDDPSKRKEYEETKEKVAREAFLAVRSRNGMDFADYFASTLCSVSQPLNEQQYVKLAQALYEDTDKVRTLTMLALSASS
jgi:CRISPR-associated protein Cmx8